MLKFMLFISLKFLCNYFKHVFLLYWILTPFFLYFIVPTFV